MLKIIHNPRCSKSRQTLALIEESGQAVEVIEYLKNPLAREEIVKIAALLKVSPLEMMRTKETEFKEQNLKGESDEALFDAMAQFPKLIERPIVIKGEQAVIGRPPENVLSLL